MKNAAANISTSIMEIRTLAQSMRLRKSETTEAEKNTNKNSRLTLVQRGFVESVKSVIEAGQYYELAELATFVQQLEDATPASHWKLEVIDDDFFCGCILVSEFESIEPCIIFQLGEMGYFPNAINFDFKSCELREKHIIRERVKARITRLKKARLDH